MVGMAQLVRALGCGPGDRGFESHYSPHFFMITVDHSGGASPSGKARDFDSRIRWFESSRPSLRGSRFGEGSFLMQFTHKS